MNNLKIKTRLTGAFIALIIMLILSNVLSIIMITRVSNKKDKIFEQYGHATEKMAMAYSDYQELKFLLRNMIYIHEFDDAARADDINRIYETMDDMSANAGEFEALTDTNNKEIKNQLDTVNEQIAGYTQNIEMCIKYVQEYNFDAAKQLLMGQMIDYALGIDGDVEKLVSIVDTAKEDENQKLYKNTFMIVIGVGVIGVVAVIFSILVDVSCQTAIRKPIRLLLEALHKIEKGDVNITVQKIRNDELGELVDGFNRLIETTKEQAEVASEVAKGNLTVTVTPRGEEDVLGNALASLVSENNAVLSNIQVSSVEVTTGSQQVADASQSLAKGSTEQASAIEEITASINDIAERTRKNAEQANEANDLVANTKEDAKKGNMQMQSMIFAMAEINESSENISKIIKVIDDIAFQTNILALNAAVEAARAGVHGKGFAVVAEEVRNLAGKSADAARETAQMIEDSIKKVENGSALAEETAKALESIVQAVEQIVSITSDIADASNEQATAVAQIDQAIGQVSQVVQTNSATSEQCAAASEELSNQAARLREMIQRFRLNHTEIQ